MKYRVMTARSSKSGSSEMKPAAVRWSARLISQHDQALLRTRIKRQGSRLGTLCKVGVDGNAGRPKRLFLSRRDVANSMTIDDGDRSNPGNPGAALRSNHGAVLWSARKEQSSISFQADCAVHTTATEPRWRRIGSGLSS